MLKVKNYLNIQDLHILKHINNQNQLKLQKEKRFFHNLLMEIHMKLQLILNYRTLQSVEKVMTIHTLRLKCLLQVDQILLKGVLLIIMNFIIFLNRDLQIKYLQVMLLIKQQSIKLISTLSTITNQVKIVQKPLNDEKDKILTFESAYKSIQDQLFNKKRELFTDFVEKNDLLNVYGPLNMRTRPKEFREVKNYALDPNQLKLLKEQRSRQQITPTNRSGFTDLIKTVRLPTISKIQGLDTDKYYNKDQNYLNKLTNSIIIEKIDQNIKHKNKTLSNFNKNKHSIKHNTEDTENMQGIIDIFEKHLEFEKQYNC
ncbi:unnamed protein product [Paramecium primaurelia]|uniref:Transmembrane protein n=1 Tax=Paramecium primaurelia TaxID=5886 RepID=A0A8S1K9P8_PARPR|nr:unnamed protein product [Paramecium primaurelia]